jgi:hypothetical protein
VAIDTTLLEKIGSPAALLKYKSKEKLAFSRTLHVPERVGTGKRVLAKEYTLPIVKY